MHTFSVYRAACLLAGCSFSISVSAVPFDASLADQELLRQQERDRLRQEQQQAAPDVRLPRDVSVLPDYPSDERPCFPIRQLVLEGELSARFQWALEAAQNAKQRCLGAKGVNLVMQKVQNSLISRGFVTSRVFVRPQDLASGTLTLTMVPGRIHSIRFADPVPARARWFNAMPARPGDVLNLRDIEQALENFKRVPALDADIQIEPATEEGQSDLVIAWKESRPVRLGLSLDDGGSKATGRYQGNVSVSLDNLLTLDDLFSLSLGKDLFQDQPLGSRSRAVNYSIPFGYWQLGGAYSHYRYFQQIAGANETYIYRGDSENSQLFLSRVLYRDNAHKTTLSLRGYQRKSRNFVDDTEIQIQHRQTAGWELGLNHRAYLGRNTLDASLTWRHGTGALGALPAPEEASGDGSSRPSIVLSDINLTVPFKLGSQNGRYSALVRGQWSKGPLAAQDRFAIGGRYTVRGFDGELSLSSERGWLWRNELAWALGHSGQEGYLGLDAGRVYGQGATYLRGRQLAGCALGLRGVLMQNVSYELFTGWPIVKPAGFDTAAATAGFNLNLQF
ncbi:ShlB/FhaC/HecB family hemolysin secretion/activation protein [Chromobacterium sp. ATCC 53434]|uniref:ShlB/FhaC/HecB family hemolysin secretion/activation protein n=1 Tax=Chromobacterium sp. (strain ATCC 53434 / SC 14030) TaxID=2059672 RepID=UPI0018F11A6E|nr:ShlB/FhaC/HecB family hemolysin secretion/activation protein [Chromobacterium sp. ATCC 53434]